MRQGCAYRRNSVTQLATVDSGATIRNGPRTPRSRRYARKAMHWSVLPRPISSARMPLRPFSKRDTSHSTPASW